MRRRWLWAALAACEAGPGSDSFWDEASDEAAAGELGEAEAALTDSCHVNLVMWAWHRDARAGGDDQVLVGSHDGDSLANGRVDQDQARLMVVRERGLAGADRALRRRAR